MWLFGGVALACGIRNRSGRPYEEAMFLVGVCNKTRSVKRAAPPIGLPCFVCKCVFRLLVIHDWGVIHGN